MPDFSVISDQIKLLAITHGFDLAGIAGVAPPPELNAFGPWIEAGRHGEMQYLAARDAHGSLKRESLQNAAPWARSVIVCAVNYNADAPYSTHAGATREGWIARYAWSEIDYHDVVLARLRKLEGRVADLVKDSADAFRSWCYVDTGPIVERVFAKYAGIGWIGKNTCILNQQLGSWLFLGVILTNLALQPDLPAEDRCGSCTRFLLDDRETRRYPGRSPRSNGTTCLRLRYLPGRLSVEPQGATWKPGRVSAEARAHQSRSRLACSHGR
jgi:epoxyqueuosine reductase